MAQHVAERCSQNDAVRLGAQLRSRVIKPALKQFRESGG
jgi:hypothetical protein